MRWKIMEETCFGAGTLLTLEAKDNAAYDVDRGTQATRPHGREVPKVIKFGVKKPGNCASPTRRLDTRDYTTKRDHSVSHMPRPGVRLDPYTSGKAVIEQGQMPGITFVSPACST
jgi:hypothetical protein